MFEHVRDDELYYAATDEINRLSTNDPFNPKVMEVLDEFQEEFFKRIEKQVAPGKLTDIFIYRDEADIPEVTGAVLLSKDGRRAEFPIGETWPFFEARKIPNDITAVLPRRPHDRSQPHPALIKEETKALNLYHQDLRRTDPYRWLDMLKDPDRRWITFHSVFEAYTVQGLMADKERIPSGIVRPNKHESGDFVLRDARGRVKTTFELKGIFSSLPPWTDSAERRAAFKESYNDNSDAFTEKLKRRVIDENNVLILDTQYADQEAIDHLSEKVSSSPWKKHVRWYP